MAKLLLSSSQVQVMASSFVIILCTFALFFSGYMIQQRTLRELRVAIQPRGPQRGSRRGPQSVSEPSPQAYLPERFRTTTKELEDGTIVQLESEAEKEAKEQQVVIVVKQTKPDEQGDKMADHKVNTAAKQKNIDIVEELKAKASEKMKPVKRPEAPVKEEKPLTRAQRRKMIKQDLQRSAQLEEPAYYQRRMW
ncbi:hypothetical protein B0J13DRAFT_611645 [Dactylonectria estremocensis]|uniref:Uncharacterized protein n=1 Tax=Dactylonectria estremocensis TaxID=1079267 RepID=A0A9P9DVN8_9HYPO|nr:hypothetical protein B0J13DRAFT_611645 [Dactylonectria estremocensis]